MRLGDWKLVREGRGDWELYNVSVDRTETRNLAKERPELVETLKQLWEDWADRAYVRH